jgi:putative membrane protein
MNLINVPTVLATLLYAGIGIVVYAVGFFVLDKLTPYHLWREITEKQNSALAILIGAISIGLAIIVSAALHG